MLLDATMQGGKVGDNVSAGKTSQAVYIVSTDNEVASRYGVHRSLLMLVNQVQHPRKRGHMR